MTSEDVRSELDKKPFIPFRLHLASGKSVDVRGPGQAWMLKEALLILHDQPPDGSEAGYDIISLWNIERLEQLPKQLPNG